MVNDKSSDMPVYFLLIFLHKKKQQNNIPLDEVSYDLAESLKEGSYFNGTQAELKLQQALLTLPEKQRLVFNMKYSSGI